MLSDVGDVADFDLRKLNDGDILALQRSDCIALVNWSANMRGNSLAERVFSVNGRDARLNFLDPADISGAENRIRPLKKFIDGGLIDVISLNENETRILTRVLSVRKLPRRYRAEDVLRASANLYNVFQAAVDIHTPTGSASTHDGQQAWSPAPGFVGGFVTGAGDVWDAGDIIGHLLRFNVDDRLRFANASAYLYLSSGRFRPPNLREIMRFLAKRSKTKRPKTTR
jgi:hypothetical protein